MFFNSIRQKPTSGACPKADLHLHAGSIVIRRLHLSEKACERFATREQASQGAPNRCYRRNLIERSQAAPSLVEALPRATSDGWCCPLLDARRCQGAIDFYKQALGTEEIGERVKMDDGRIMNAKIDVNGASVMLMDPS